MFHIARSSFMKTRLLSLFALVGFLGARAEAQIPYDECGNLIQGVSCVLFEDTMGRQWLLDNNGGFPVGSNLRVQGLADPSCFTICLQGDGCIAVSGIGPCGGPTPTGTPFCFGDGSGTACPCSNNSPAGQNVGCLNSLGSGGKLQGSGIASVSNDTLTLHGSGMPNSSALYFQGTAQLAGGAGVVFGDGLRCVGGSIIRLGIQTNSGGSSQFPVFSPQISLQGNITAGDTREYQVWYRNADPSFCTPSTFNLTNGVEITWVS
jgi:hypothetical protein